MTSAIPRHSTWLGGFLRGQLLVVVIITFLIGIGAYLIGLPYLAVFITIVFVSEFVPVLGGYVAGIIGILFGFSHSITMGLIMIAFTWIMFGVVEGQILIPRITGRAVHVHPLVVLFVVVGMTLLALRFVLRRPVPEIIPDRLLVFGCIVGLAAFLIGNWLAVPLRAL